MKGSGPDEKKIGRDTKRKGDERARLEQLEQTGIEVLIKMHRTPSDAPGESKTSTALNVKLAFLSEKDGIEAYLVTFERIMTAQKVEKERWSQYLAPQLYLRVLNREAKGQLNIIGHQLHRSMVRQKWVPTEKIIDGKIVSIRCACGDTKLYNLLDLTLQVHGVPLWSRQ